MTMNQSEMVAEGFKVAADMRDDIVRILRARYKGVGEDKIQDLTQDLTIEIAQSYHKFDPSLGVPVKAYFGRMIRWRLNDDVRKSKTRNHTDLDGSVGDEESSATLSERIPCPNSATDANHSMSEVMSVFEGLPESEINLCMDYFVNGLAYKEIAKKYNMPMGSVMSKKFRLRDKFVTALTRMGYDPSK